MIESDNRAGPRIALRAGFGVLALLGFAAAALLLPMKEYVRELVAWIDGLGAWGYAAMIAAYVAACVLFVPGSILTLASGALFGAAAGTAVVSAGSTLGAAAAFLVARYFAREAVERRILRSPKFAALDRAVGGHGFKLVLLTRLSPVFPFNALNYAYGLTRVPFGTYILASWIGMLPGTAMYVYLGAAAKDLTRIFSGDLEPAAGETAMKALGLAATIAVTIYVTRIGRRALQGRLDEPAAPERAATESAVKLL